MKAGRPRSILDRSCAYCAKVFRPWNKRTSFCSRFCANRSRIVEPPVPQYAYRGRLSDALWREIHAARAEAATAPLFRPGSVA
jgi:hypothetical protein